MSTQSILNITKLWAMHAGVIALAVLATAASGNTWADANDAVLEQKETLTFDVDQREVILYNLVGKIDVFPSRSSQLRIEATIVAAGKNAEANLDLIKLDTDEGRKKIEIKTLYPTDDYKYFYYKPDDRRSYGSSRTRYLGDKAEVGGKSSKRNAIDLHVDFAIFVPQGASFTIKNSVGEINASEVNADLDLNNNSGPVSASDGSGNLRLDTGSGSLVVSNHNGDVSMDSGSGRITVTAVSGSVNADTGSGSIDIRDVSGDVDADTGSGRVEILDVSGNVLVDTGSGSVDVTRATGSVSADTGSGSIDLNDWRGGKKLHLDTGSGSVEVRGDFSALEDLHVDTGSGDVDLQSSATPSLVLYVESNSRIEVDFPQMTNVKTTRHSFRGTIGDGRGRGSIDTGSGSVSFTGY